MGGGWPPLSEFSGSAPAIVGKHSCQEAIVSTKATEVLKLYEKKTSSAIDSHKTVSLIK